MEDSLDNNKSTIIFFTIKDLKWCFINASIDSKIDSHFCYSYIVRPVFLVLIQKVSTKDVTNSVIHDYV